MQHPVAPPPPPPPLPSLGVYCYLILMLSSDVNTQTALNSNGKYSIGVRLSPNLKAVERRKAASPIEAAEIALGETGGIAGKTLDAFVHLASTGDTEGV